jgi:hypothetical protein
MGFAPFIQAVIFDGDGEDPAPKGIVVIADGGHLAGYRSMDRRG